MNELFEQFLREMLSPRFCKNCGIHFSSDDIYCGKCGKPNPEFLHIDFENLNQKTVQEELKRCQAGHQSDQNIFLEDPGLFKDVNYCSVCGERLVFKVIPITIGQTK